METGVANGYRCPSLQRREHAASADVLDGCMSQTRRDETWVDETTASPSLAQPPCEPTRQNSLYSAHFPKRPFPVSKSTAVPGCLPFAVPCRAQLASLSRGPTNKALRTLFFFFFSLQHQPTASAG
ncbi:hypothetical protein PMIN06_004818 [Paraphaeosphaeria minitans]